MTKACGTNRGFYVCGHEPFLETEKKKKFSENIPNPSV